MLHRAFLALGLFLCPALALAETGDLTGVHALALHGEPKYPPDFAHFDYVNPDAPKGGSVKLGAFGSFDDLNGFILKGEAAEGLGLVYDTLLVSSADEAFSEYGLLAESVDVPADRSWVAFNLRPEARFSDGQPVTAEDVVWTFNTLMKQGAPHYRNYYADVINAVAESPTRVKFTFKGPGNRELPLIVGQLPVLPKHAWDGKDFAATTLTPPVGSGPYRISAVDPGRSLTYERREDYWARDLPANKGRYNFAEIRYDYYRDENVMITAFKAGDLDYRSERVARLWATGYDFPAVRDGRVIKAEIRNQSPQGMQGFIFNTRRPVFSDVRVRHALALLFDFEWMNANLFNGQYTRSLSYFANSELASSGLPTPDELAVLEPLRGKIPETVFTTPFTLPVTKGDGNIRDLLQQAADLLKQAGWEPRKGVMTNVQTGQPLTFEVLLYDSAFERIIQPYLRNLERIGIKATLRLVDTAQYLQRVTRFDFDLISGGFAQSLSPGNEQMNYWSTAAADTEGSANYAGVRDSAIDTLVGQLIRATDRQQLITIARALDRVLLNGWYVVPNWHMPAWRVAYWNRFGKPAVQAPYSLGFPDTWWVDADRDAVLKRRDK